ncbi:hypothetical protein PROFUN_06617 [Planoprotostelium fungivorum]|uniref:Uncharacterized protein n=1 Tax=Planoprotostelium fungivorum TaxID=1890364 RepID=A0A2P6MSU2_9EUKA|nr:hypothetical protein PROFUN_06617 [Planoprotostelium fungivorum]
MGTGRAGAITSKSKRLLPVSDNSCEPDFRSELRLPTAESRNGGNVHIPTRETIYKSPLCFGISEKWGPWNNLGQKFPTLDAAGCFDYGIRSCSIFCRCFWVKIAIQLLVNTCDGVEELKSGNKDCRNFSGPLCSTCCGKASGFVCCYPHMTARNSHLPAIIDAAIEKGSTLKITFDNTYPRHSRWPGFVPLRKFALNET